MDTKHCETKHEQHRTHALGATINNEPTATNHRLRTDSSLRHLGAKMHFTDSKNSEYNQQIPQSQSADKSQIFKPNICKTKHTHVS